MKSIGIIGYGSKRYQNVYREILKKTGVECYLWNRSKKNIQLKTNEKIVDSLQELGSKKLDLFLCFLPSDKNFDVVTSAFFSNTVLIETPVTDRRWLNFNNFKIGVLEQWPYYPLEQFKRELYESKLISKPYIIFNDGRSFDYHAMAQMRYINNHPMPVKCVGHVKNEFCDEFIDFTGNINKSLNDDWTHGIVHMSDNTTIMYSFAYNCKKSILKPFQLLRHVSKDGSITTGRNLELGNDYEMAFVTYLDGKNPKYEKIVRDKDKKDITKKISISSLEWQNDYYDLGLIDSEVAIACMLRDAKNGNMYSTINSYVDLMTMSGIKQSSYNNQVVNFSKE